MPHIKGEFVVTDPTEFVLFDLISAMSVGFTLHDVARCVKLVVGYMGTPARSQLGPGLEAITGDGRKANQVRFRWERFVLPVNPEPASPEPVEEEQPTASRTDRWRRRGRPSGGDLN